MPDFSKVKVDDTVYSDLHGYGKVVSVRDGGLDIKFDAPVSDIKSYRFDGVYLPITTSLPVLHWEKPEFEEPPPPKRKVKETLWVNVYKASNSVVGFWCSNNLFRYETAARYMAKGDSGYLGAFPVEVEYEEE